MAIIGVADDRLRRFQTAHRMAATVDMVMVPTGTLIAAARAPVDIVSLLLSALVDALLLKDDVDDCDNEEDDPDNDERDDEPVELDRSLDDDTILVLLSLDNDDEE